MRSRAIPRASAYLMSSDEGRQSSLRRLPRSLGRPDRLPADCSAATMARTISPAACSAANISATMAAIGGSLVERPDTATPGPQNAESRSSGGCSTFDVSRGITRFPKSPQSCGLALDQPFASSVHSLPPRCVAVSYIGEHITPPPSHRAEGHGLAARPQFRIPANQPLSLRAGRASGIDLRRCWRRSRSA